MRTTLFLFLLLAGFSAQADQLSSIDGHKVELGKPGWQHLVVFELWTNFNGEILDFYQTLPEKYRQQTEVIWVETPINVTNAQIQKFQDTFPDMTPLVVDHNFELMRRYGIWQHPAHILLKDGEPVFSGSNEQLIDYLETQF